MNPKAIHETTFAEILDVLKSGISAVDSVFHKKGPSIEKTSSIARATEGMTLVFPVICSNACTIENATMVAKAIERRNISLLQIAFQSYNITSSTDAVDHLRKFHTNLDEHKFTLDKFASVMNSLNESTTAFLLSSKINAINEDCKRNINFTFEDDINETSLLQYKEIYKFDGGASMIIKEASKNSKDKQFGLNYGLDKAKFKYQQKRDKKEDEYRNSRDEYQKSRDDVKDKQFGMNYGMDKAKFKYQQSKDTKEYEYRKSRDEEKDRQYTQNYDLDKDRFDYQKYRDEEKDRQYQDDKLQKQREEIRKNALDVSDKTRQYLQNQLLPSDVKKANEMQPSLMIINFYVNDKDKDLNIAQQAIAGVKSKIYTVDSSDIMNRIIKKNVDSDILLKLVKVSTREISFFKDFLLGIDDAKLDALTKSKRGSSSAIFKVLERRALGGKIRKRLGSTNNAKAITSLVITMEEAEQLQKYNDVDVLEPRVIIPIMESLNLLYFIIIDDVSESIKLFIDGQTEYEDIAFSSLEKESSDSTYKKVINLMTKISR